MALRINNNIPSMMATRYMDYHQQRVSKCIYRLSSGKRINTPADDPAGFLIAQKFKARLRELDSHIKFTEYQQDNLDTTHSDLMSRQNILGRMYEIAVRVSSDTLTQDDKNILMAEFDELAKEVFSSTYQRTGMEVVALNKGVHKGELAFKKGDMVYLKGEWQNLSDLIPSDSDSTPKQKLIPEDIKLEDSVAFDGEGVPIELPEISDKSIDGIQIDGEFEKTVDEPATMSLIDYVKDMIKGNLSSMGDVSAVASRLTFKLGRLYAEEANAAEALSRIEDADFVGELMEFVKEKALLQCATLMAAQANAQPERVLFLLDETLGVRR